MAGSPSLPFDPAAAPAPAVTLENCSSTKGPFYHGTKAVLKVGDLLIPGYTSNFEANRISNNIYFTATMDAAIWGAELSQGELPGRIYQVQPTGLFEDDPNLTDKRFKGNPTKSYRTQHPLKVTVEILDWVGHPLEVLHAMRDSLAELQDHGQRVIDD